MRKITQEELNIIMDEHEKWIDNKQGKRADLSYMDLEGLDMSCRRLHGALFIGTNIYEVNFEYCSLYNTNFSESSIQKADFMNATLINANFANCSIDETIFNGAKIKGANFSDVSLYETSMENVIYDARTSFLNMTCPEEGAFIGFKHAYGFIIKLEICADAKRSSATSRKCRCSKAKVLSITKLNGSPTDITKIPSEFDDNFVYRIGETVEVNNFDENRWNECSTGIHFFITRDEAVNYGRI